MSMRHKNIILLHLVPLLGALLLSSCGKDKASGGGCDVVANPQQESFFQVTNELSSGLEWVIPAFAFGGDMKPGECNRFGVANGSYTVELTQCNIGDSQCTSTFGPTVSQMFSVASGETYVINVAAGLFQ